jgi:BirA family biotin operon repressor/biotin-[acetyl-CoA-carboxylase] ligase
MDVAREQVQQRTSEDFPLLVLTEEQTAGRGRMRRPWGVPPGSALLFSLVLCPRWLALADAAALIWLAGVSLCEGITTVTPLEPRLKWPNDVLLPGACQPDEHPHSGMHKIAGILLESSSSNGHLDWAIIGCGLNVHASPPADMSLRYPASSLDAALGQAVPQLPLLRAILRRMDYWYNQLATGEIQQLFTTWRGLLITLGQQVQIQTDAGLLCGLAEDVDLSGALHLRDDRGQVHVITNGDVSG